jgi:hypothetical protein
MNERIRRNDPCPCGSGKKYKKCCLGKDDLSNDEEDSISCYQCKKSILKPELCARFRAGDGKEICFCTVCYREMSCKDCGRKLGLKSFTIHWCPDCNKIHIECRECVIDRIKRQKNIPHWQKIRVRGLMKRSRALIRASLEEEELTHEGILDSRVQS